jgi:hypothetical protein|tara:strand:+ start:328 stop:780 length:453 start_codon:yes stop_codon:yes gene_type:complete
MSKPKKKFKDTKVGSFLLSKLPGLIGDILPNKGALGVLKNIIDKDPDTTPEEKAQLHKELVSLYELEVADRDSARKREVEKAKSGGFDLMFNLTGIVGLSAFAFIIYAIVYLKIPESNKEVWIHLIGISEGIVLSIFGYFYGSAVRKNKD